MNNTSEMKKCSFSFILKAVLLGLVIIVFCQTSFSQDRIKDIKVESKPVSKRNAEDGSITIHVDGNNSSFTFKLLDKEPWSGGKEILTAPDIYDNNYTFSNIAKGDYIVCVIDSDENIRCQKVTVSTK